MELNEAKILPCASSSPFPLDSSLSFQFLRSLGTLMSHIEVPSEVSTQPGRQQQSGLVHVDKGHRSLGIKI